jgi:hypothetical protein
VAGTNVILTLNFNRKIPLFCFVKATPAKPAAPSSAAGPDVEKDKTPPDEQDSQILAEYRSGDWSSIFLSTSSLLCYRLAHHFVPYRLVHYFVLSTLYRLAHYFVSTSSLLFYRLDHYRYFVSISLLLCIN